MRLPVGRPIRHVSREWPQTDEEDLRPTAAYLWDGVALPHATQARAYIEYINELDACLCKYLLSISYSCYFISCNNINLFGTYLFQVSWMPYESPEIMVLQESHGLNSMCLRDKTLWTTSCPLIFYYAVEYHLPSRVIRQFGLEQPIRPPCMSTSVELHRHVLNCMIYMYYPS
jgi:hypothetical protein